MIYSAITKKWQGIRINPWDFLAESSWLINLVTVTNIFTEFTMASTTYEVMNSNNKTSMKLEKHFPNLYCFQ